MKRKGFTLIELLAVIVILAIIALITIPMILNVIDKARTGAYKDSAYGIIKATELYQTEKQLDNSLSIEGNLLDIMVKRIKGAKPASGEVYLTDKGRISVAL